MVATNPESVNARRRDDIAYDRHLRPLGIKLPADAKFDIFADDVQERPKPKARPANENAKSHDALISGNAGFVTNAIDFVERLLADQEIEQQSLIIARKLAEAGWNPYLKSESQVVLIGTVTGSVRDAGSNFRNCNIIPSVACRNRADKLSEFRLFLQENKEARKYSRYAVISSGARFPLEELPERYDEFNARIGRFLELAPKTFPVDIHLITIEMTFDAESTVNLHANVVYQPKAAFGTERWNGWLEFGRAQLETSFFHDEGRLEEPAELIKYVCKPGEILSLTSKQTAFLATTLHKKQLVRPVGPFADWRKAFRDSGHKARYDREAKAIVRVQRATREEKIKAEIEKQERDEACAAGKIEDGEKQKSEIVENQILCTTLPQARSSLLAEAYVVVRNYTPQPSTANGIGGLEALERRRVHYLNKLAAKGVARDVIERASSPSSIFNNLTIIPATLFLELPKLTEKRRKRLFERLHLPDGSPLAFFEQALRIRMQTLLPTRRHAWSRDVANISLLYDAQVTLQATLKAELKAAREKLRTDKLSQYDEYEEYDEYDEIIPFAPPLIKYGPRPDVPLAPSVRERLWTPSPPIVRPPRPQYVPPPRAAHLPPPPRKPSFMRSASAA
ncbi:hypothetical protein V1282_003545 [Nitrobacteraceae bacterium AZCC 2146]